MVGDDSGGAALVLSLTDGRIRSVAMGAMTPDWFEPVAVRLLRSACGLAACAARKDCPEDGPLAHGFGFAG